MTEFVLPAVRHGQRMEMCASEGETENASEPVVCLPASTARAEERERWSVSLRLTLSPANQPLWPTSRCLGNMRHGVPNICIADTKLKYDRIGFSKSNRIRIEPNQPKISLSNRTSNRMTYIF